MWYNRFIKGYDTFVRDEYVARDGRTFEDLYKLVCKYHSYKAELQKLKGLVLKKPTGVDIRDGRLTFLNEFLQMQIKYLQKQC